MHTVGILAHQGGWDEIALVVGPILVFAAMLAVARRRALLHAATGSAESAEET